MHLNDLDIIGNKILVNVYLTTLILELDLSTGKLLRHFYYLFYCFKI